MARSPLRCFSRREVACAALALAGGSACRRSSSSGSGEIGLPGLEAPDPPEVVAGERLFLETSFAQFLFARSGGHPNRPLKTGDPVVDQTQRLAWPLAGSFRGLSMNCRSCHLVDEHADAPRGGNRTYADFVERSRVPAREDGRTVTARNSPPLVKTGGVRNADPRLLRVFIDGADVGPLAAFLHAVNEDYE